MGNNAVSIIIAVHWDALFIRTTQEAKLMGPVARVFCQEYPAGAYCAHCPSIVPYLLVCYPVARFVRYVAPR